jgi:hypothetical protein
MTMTKQRLLLLTILGGAFATLVGCELAVNFDRSKIPVDATDAGDLDVFTPAVDSGGTDAGATDSGTDGGSATDSGGSDSGDSGGDASDAGTD